MFPNFTIDKTLKLLKTKGHNKKFMENTTNFSPHYADFGLNLLSQQQKDPIINNFNVKVNITKKKTKNISIANLTLNNQNLQKSVNVSPKNSEDNDDDTEFVPKNMLYNYNRNEKNEIKNANSVLNSPKRSYNKIISNLKNEFREITKKNPCNSKDEEGSFDNNDVDDYCKFKYEKKKSNHTNKTFLKNNLFTSVNHSKDDKWQKSQKLQTLKLHTQSKSKDHSFLFNQIAIEKSPFINKKIKKKCINITTNHNTNLNTNVNTVSNISSIISNPISFSITKPKTTNKSNIEYELQKEKEEHEKSKEALKESNKLIDLLQKYIIAQQNVFIENKTELYNEYMKVAENDKIKKLNVEIEELINQNKELKLTVLKMLYMIEKNSNDSIENKKKLSEKISQLLKENEYLRHISGVINYQHLNFLSNLNQQINSGTLFKKEHITISREKNEIENNKLDLFSTYMKNSKMLEKTIKKDINSKSNSIIKQKTFINSNPTKRLFPKHTLRYSKKPKA